MNSGWSSRRSQLPSGCLRATCALAPAPSRAIVAVSAMSPLVSAGSGSSGANRGMPGSSFSHRSLMAVRPTVRVPGG